MLCFEGWTGYSELMDHSIKMASQGQAVVYISVQ